MRKLLVILNSMLKAAPPSVLSVPKPRHFLVKPIEIQYGCLTLRPIGRLTTSVGHDQSAGAGYLERIVLLAFLNMASDSCADDLGDRLAIDGRDHVQFLRLVGRQANRHCLDSFHSQIVSDGIVVVNIYGIVVSFISTAQVRDCKEGLPMVSENELDRDGLDKPEEGVPGIDKPEDDKTYTIQIDRTEYVVTQNRMTGADLRRVPTPPIPADRDLFQIIPGRPDEKVEDDDRILVTDGLRFFTAPQHH